MLERRVQANDWVEKGNRLFDQNRDQEALEAFDRAIHVDPNISEAWFSKGKIFQNYGKYVEALQSFDRALEIEPNRKVYWTSKCYTLKKLKRYEEASNAYNNGKPLDPLLYWFFNGFTLRKLGNYKESLKSFKEALKIDPNDFDIFYNIVDNYIQLTDYQSALKAIRKAEKNNQNDASVYFLKGTILQYLGSNEEALDAFNKAIDLDPNNEEYQNKYKNFKDNTLDVLETKFEPILEQLHQTGNLQYIEKFCEKFPNCKKNSPDFSKLQQLLEKKGCMLSNEELNIIIIILSKRQASKMFKTRMLHNNPKTSDELLRNFLIVFGESYNEHIDEILKILREDFNYGKKDIHRDISKIRNEIELEHFESCLMSTSHSGKKITIDDIDTLSGKEFEILLKRLFESLGYSVTHTKISKDQGADLIIEKLGERIVVQAKNWTANVGNSAIQEIFASINHYKASRSIVISSSGFTNEGIDLAHSNKVELWDRKKLAQLLNQNPIFT